MQLYTSADLLDGYDAKDKSSYVKTWDFRRFAEFIAAGGSTSASKAEAIRQADHDAGISVALRDWLQQLGTPRLVGIMGSHGLLRDAPAFRLIADLARDLTRAGYVVVTGGGPGAMEAGHFGAYFANSAEANYDAALRDLKAQPKLVSLNNVLKPDGSVDPAQEPAIEAAWNWLTAALIARTRADGTPGTSLAVPTWLYGSEPTTPFATAYAKYYQNSIREETLVAEGQTGVIFAQGGGGTLREVFQAVERNFYQTSAAAFTPMIFVDPDGFWEHDATYNKDDIATAPGMKLDTTLRAIFKYAIRDPAVRAECQKKVCFTADFDTIETVLAGHAPVAQQHLDLMLKGIAANFFSARLAR